MHASTRERCLGCSLGCSTDLENGRDRGRVRPPRDPICRDWLCDEEQRGLRHRITVITGDAVGGELPAGYDVFLLANLIHHYSSAEHA